jgi:hypothetical protein
MKHRLDERRYRKTQRVHRQHKATIEQQQTHMADSALPAS